MSLNEKVKKTKTEFVDLRFTDILGKHHHVTIPANNFSDDIVKHGKPFDGSSIQGWKGIEDSDMVLKPDGQEAFFDPFREHKTMVVFCDVYNPDMTVYSRDPRGLARRAEDVLKQSKIADKAFFGPEMEFFVFDQISWKVGMGSSFYKIESFESCWGTHETDGQGHRLGIKGGYFPVPPSDSLHDFRSAVCHICNQLGLFAEVHHHEVATAGQCEIGTKMGEAVTRSDHSQIFKYIVRNYALEEGKIATFMPKPLMDDNGSGMHVHQSLLKNGKNIFAGNEYAGLSKTALHYIGGILKHSKALNAFTNPTTNSYKRLIPGFEAPTILGYSKRNRSVSIRIPHVAKSNQARMEVRYPDSTANPYLAFPALLCAGLDGIRNKIDPGKPSDGNLYELSEREASKRPQVSATLNDALIALDKDRKFLTTDGIFDDDLIDAFIEMKIQESKLFRSAPHPIEFDLYLGS